MDLTPFHAWFVFAHIAGAFLFAAGHGVSVFVSFRIRRERHAAAIRGMLDLSSWSLNVASVGLLLLLVTGIVAGFTGNWWGRWWIWLSLLILIVVGGLMTPLGGTWFAQLRRAVGMRTRDLKAGQPDPVPASEAELTVLLDSKRPEQLLLIGGVGFVAILALMTFKPF